MPPIIKITDNNNLIETNTYPHLKFPFEKFNPPQSRVMEIYDKDCNAILSARTSGGKTVMSELFIGDEICRKKGKALFLGPLKALVKEKLDDWMDEKHSFSKYKIAICSGDYQLSSNRKKELEEADIIVMTNEMLSARVRNYKSENNEFLNKIGTIVYDEFHTIGTPSRGSHLEVGLMKFTKINPNCRIIGLSGTMKNADEIAEWLSYGLNHKETYLLKSDYRPCPLGIHWESYYNGGRYEDQENSKVNKAIEIISDYPNDNFLIFAHTKRTGKIMCDTLLKNGVKAEFHSAGLDKENRIKLENKFRSGNLQYVVATSTLAQGVNLPARRVIVLGVHRAMDEVEDHEIWQEAGRAGRPGYDPRGDVYILVPEGNEQKHINRLNNPNPITSKINVPKILGFHLVSEIHHGEVETKEDIHKWYEKSLAFFQNKEVNEEIVDATLDTLEKCGAIKCHDGKYEVIAIGKISSMFYYSPFDVSDLRKNFSTLFENKLEDNDFILSLCLGNIDSIRSGIVSKAELLEMAFYRSKMIQLFKGHDPPIDTSLKGGFIYFSILNGLNSGGMASLALNAQMDSDRLLAVLGALDAFGAKWGRKEWFSELSLRLKYGVKQELVPLCKVKEIGKARAEKLYAAGLRTPSDMVKNPEKVKKTLNLKDEIIKEIINDAKNIDFLNFI